MLIIFIKIIMVFPFVIILVNDIQHMVGYIASLNLNIHGLFIYNIHITI